MSEVSKEIEKTGRYRIEGVDLKDGDEFYIYEYEDGTGHIFVKKKDSFTVGTLEALYASLSDIRKIRKIRYNL